jgi:topoisomerase-4 subunit A
MKTFKLSEVQAEAILNMRLRNLRKLEEMEIRAEDKALREERTKLKSLIGSPAQQWKTIAGQIKELKNTFGPKNDLGRRRTTFGIAPAHDEAAIEEAMVVREPITVVVSEKGWIRALRGHVTDLSGVTFKTDDDLKFAFPTETTAKILIFGSNGRFYTIEASKLPGGRGHGSRSAYLSTLKMPTWSLHSPIKADASFWLRATAVMGSWCRGRCARNDLVRANKCLI